MVSQRKKNKVTIFSKVNASILFKGKKFKNEIIFLNISRSLKKKNKVTIFCLLLQIVNKVKPYVGLYAKQVGSKVHKIPISLSVEKEFAVGVNWIVKESCGWKKGPFNNLIFSEFEAILTQTGKSKSLKKKIALHKLAEENRVFIKYLL